jgi:hypothetical protein
MSDPASGIQGTTYYNSLNQVVASGGPERRIFCDMDTLVAGAIGVDELHGFPTMIE